MRDIRQFRIENFQKKIEGESCYMLFRGGKEEESRKNERERRERSN